MAVVTVSQRTRRVLRQAGATKHLLTAHPASGGLAEYKQAGEEVEMMKDNRPLPET